MAQNTSNDEKIINKLEWLNQRSTRDYKGNPPPFERRMTRASIEKIKEQHKAKLSSEADFLPFSHGPTHLCEDAVPLRHLKSCTINKFQHQRRSEAPLGVSSCLQWTKDPFSSSSRLVRKPRYSNSSVSYDATSLMCMTPEERAAAYRKIMIQHPKVNRDSISLHQERWNQGTQLSGTLLTHTGTRCSAKNVFID